MRANPTIRSFLVDGVQTAVVVPTVTLFAILVAAAILTASPGFAASPATAAPPTSASATPAASVAFQPSGLLVFLTDFGIEDDAIAICKGVMLGIDPELRILDLTHQVTPFEIREGAMYLTEAARFFPPGTVFVGVVDPGVGTERRAVLLETDGGQAFIAPDNGLLALVARDHGIRSIRDLTNEALMRPERSATFHGRDLFSPAGAWIASGKARPEDAGAPIDSLLPLDLTEPRITDGWIEAEVFLLDKAFGNIWTNIPRDLFISAFDEMPETVHVRIGETDHAFPLVDTFGDVAEGERLAYFNSRDFLSFALNMASFAGTYGVKARDPIRIRRIPR